MQRLSRWFYRRPPATTFVPWLPFFDGACIPPLGIFVKSKYRDDLELIAHERGHWIQFLEWGFWRFWWQVAKDYRDGRQDSDFIEQDADRRK